MKLLALDTSSTACSLALFLDDKIKSITQVAPMRQSQIVLPLLKQLLDENKIKLDQLDALVLGCGPGSFTGIRIATSIIQGLGFATGLPIICVSSLASIAQKSYAIHGWKNLLVVVDARIQEVYWGAYKISETGIAELIGEEYVTSPKEVHMQYKGTWYGVGNGWEAYQKDILCTPALLDVSQFPSASALLPIAKKKFEKGEKVSATEIVPVYLRDNVAKKQETS